MTWFAQTLIDHPEIAVLLTVGLGFWVGRIHYKSIGLGAVTGTLLVGVVIGALVHVTASDGTITHIAVDGPAKSIFFLLFLFALGFRLGPQFFSGLKGAGLAQALFAVILAVVAIATVVVLSKVLGFNPGLAAGLASGGLTQSAIIGVSQGSIAGLPESADTITQWQGLVPVAYAVTYIFGTVGTALFIANVAPRILGIKDLPAAAAALERKLGFSDPNPDVSSAYLDVVRRAYRLTALPEGVRNVAELEQYLDDRNGTAEHVFVARIRRGSGQVEDPNLDAFLAVGDTVVLTARRHDLFAAHVEPFTEEADDRELLDFPIEDLWVVASSKEVVGHTIGELATDPRSRRIFVRGLKRSGRDIPWSHQTRIDSGDEIHVQGPLPLLEAGIKHAGYPVRNTTDTNMVTVGLAIAIGALIGVPTVLVSGIPLGLSTSVGALLAGLLVGWYRTRSPKVAKLPGSTQWFLETVGLNVFIGIVGLTSGPGFVDGLRQYGLSLLLAGAVVTLLPLLVMTFLAKWVFKFDPVITLGVLCGSRSATAAVGATREAAKSAVPLLGYSVPYAIANIVLTVGGAVIVALMG
ncbi:hypothetical protein [Cellulomonas sp. NPDC089187]|uniref:aspartate-alanine antiporter-like transporter n=1 Tax=Cellulomonas sp. NPDC089187 TaxID=3154970 RepID=UPI00343E1BD1